MGISKFISSVCVQTAVYWTGATRDGYGNFTFSTGVEIPCRWDDVTEWVRNKEGEMFASSAKLLVTSDLDLQGFLWLGNLDDLSPEQQVNPFLVPRAYPIQRIEKVSMIKSTTEFVRTVYL